MEYQTETSGKQQQLSSIPLRFIRRRAKAHRHPHLSIRLPPLFFWPRQKEEEEEEVSFFSFYVANESHFQMTIDNCSPHENETSRRQNNSHLIYAFDLHDNINNTMRSPHPQRPRRSSTKAKSPTSSYDNVEPQRVASGYLVNVS